MLLRPDRTADSGYGDAIPFADLDEVEVFFASLARSESMYGWSFLDDPARTADWPDEPSLAVELRDEDTAHSLFWFNECVRGDAPYCIEGTVTFDDLEVLRADEAIEPLTDFIADGARYWRALSAGEDRMSAAAQTAAQTGTPSWRPYTGVSVTVSGADSRGRRLRWPWRWRLSRG